MTQLIAGVDEAGVGSIAGPVVAAAVILNPNQKIYHLKDSKMLTTFQRETLFDRITQRALDVSVGIASVEEIDCLNIFHATALAMEPAVNGLSLHPSIVLVDGKNRPKLKDFLIKMIINGDQLEKPISAASIIAKVTRDRIMKKYHQDFPNYCFDKHKGYSTKEHQMLVAHHGVCSIHRKSFTFIKKLLTATD